MNKGVFLLIIFFAFACSSCNIYDQKEIFIKYHNFENDTWLCNEIITFETDTVKNKGIYEVVININHRFNYPFRNLTLAYEITNNDSLICLDSRKIEFLNSKDIWKGKRIFSSIQTPIIIDTLKVIQNKNDLKIRISSLIEEKNLKGISGIGIQILEI